MKIHNKFYQAFTNPKMAFNYFYRRFLSFLYISRAHSSIQDIRSESDDGYYSQFVIKAYLNPNIFRNFRKNPIYEKVLGRDLYEDGIRFIDAIQNNWSDKINSKIINTLKSADTIGSPKTYEYDIFGKVSPTMLRYFKTALQIEDLFGSKLYNADICELGGGFGGLALVIDSLHSIRSYTIYDLYDVGNLISRYLESFTLNSFYHISTINKANSEKKYDLFISNFAFSELPKQLQLVYINKIMKNCRMGYMIMNSGFDDSPFNNNKLSFNELTFYLPELTVLKENPPEQGRYVIAWGCN